MEVDSGHHGWSPEIAMRTLTLLYSLLLALVVCPETLMGQNPSAAAERLLVNGKVFTAEPSRPYAEAVAIRDGTIVAVGSRDEAGAALGPHPETVDLQGHSRCSPDSWTAIATRFRAEKL